MKIYAFPISWVIDLLAPIRTLAFVYCLLAVLTEVAWPNPNDLQWRFSGETNDLRAVAYGDGTLVAVGNHGTILTSIDTVRWTQRLSGTTQNLRGVAYGNGLFVAVGGDASAVVLTSSDNGVSWHEQIAPTTNGLNAVTHGANTFVAVGDRGTILMSPDGTAWSKRPTGFARALLAVVHRDIQFVGSLFAAVGEAGVIFTSPDGLAWTLRNSGVLLDLYCVAALDNRRPDVICLVASGQDGVAVASIDGVEWNAVALPTDRDIYAAVGQGAIGWDAGGLFTLAGRDGVYLTSNDGLSWLTKESGTTASFRAFSRLDGGVVAVGDEGTVRCGLVWFRRHSGTTSMLHGAVHADGTYVIVGEQGTVLTSEDGIRWIPRGAALPNHYGVTYGSGKFLAVGNELSIAFSTNGIDWARTNLPAPSNAGGSGLGLQRIAYGNGAFITTGFYTPLGQSLWRPLAGFSEDGVVWRMTTDLPAGYRGYLLHPAAGLGLGQFLLAGAGLYSSTDGVDWKERIPGTYFPALAFGPERVVAVSDSRSIATSTDGVHWTVAPSSPPISADVMAYGGSAFITFWRANGVTMFATSNDGSDWKPGVLFEGILHLTDGGPPFLAVGPNCYVAGGLGGVILQSSPLVPPPQLNMRAMPNAMRLRLVSEPGKSVSIQTSTNLVDWVNWKNMTPEQPTTEVELSDPVESSRFYRAAIP